VAANNSRDHHGSHGGLLWAGDSGRTGRVDAIIVPTARTPAYLAPAAGLAEALGCTLVTLHSKRWTSADQAAPSLPRSIDLMAIDVPDVAQLNLPQWETARYLPWKIFPRLQNFPRTDLATKRNLGLLLSRLLGWSRIMFLDDDITELNPDHVRRASGLLDTHNAVGLHVCGFHDHSMVCHAYRDAGGSQQSFIGGGALVVHAERSRSFFPEIYNDDWFFLLDGDKWLQPAAVTGRVVQYPYDPFRPERARAEEFGDVLAEGIYWLLDQGLSLDRADQKHWTAFLNMRKLFIERVLDMVARDPNLKVGDKGQRSESLRESLGRLRLITPELCENYIRAWRADRQTWQDHLDSLPSGLDRTSALEEMTRKGAPALYARHRGQASRLRAADAAPSRATQIDRSCAQSTRAPEPAPAGAELAGHLS
jgi:hypothetical protein